MSPTFARTVLFTALACAAAVQAQSPEDPMEVPDGSNAPTTLSAVEVVGETANRMTWHAGPSTGAKTDLPVRELPQSVRIITRQTIDDLSANKLDLVLDYVSGISRNNNFGDLQDGVMIRGLPSGSGNFGADALLNGFSSSRGYPLPRDLAGVERVEFLKGPSAALYGSSSPGGTLNIVSKRPLWQAAHSASAAFGRHDFKRIAVDSSAPLSQNVAYRMNIAVEEGGSFREHVNPQRRVFAPALTWNLGQDTVLEYAGEVIYHKTPMDRGVVAVNGRLGAVPRERFLGEPGDGNLDLNNKTHQLILTHPLGAQWNMRLGASYRETKLLGYLTAARALILISAVKISARRPKCRAHFKQAQWNMSYCLAWKVINLTRMISFCFPAMMITPSISITRRMALDFPHWTRGAIHLNASAILPSTPKM